jgi:hypothetical protein
LGIRELGIGELGNWVTESLVPNPQFPDFPPMG